MSIVDARQAEPLDLTEDDERAARVDGIAGVVERSLADRRPPIVRRLTAEELATSDDAWVADFAPLLVQRAALRRPCPHPPSTGGTTP